MIASLRGLLQKKDIDEVVVEVLGVGFHIHVPLSTYYALPETGEDVFLWVHMVARSDAVELFGFFTEAEKEAFVSLIGVAGVGPRLARNILSGIRPEELAETIARGDGARLNAIPGVGKRIAERILVDLQGKALRFATAEGRAAPEQAVRGEEALENDVLSALLNLGYRKMEVVKALQKARNAIQGPATAQAWLREALRLLAE